MADVCMKCGAGKKSTTATGTLLCATCQKEQFDRLREKYGRRDRVAEDNRIKKEKVRDTVKRMMQEGHTAKEISEEANVSPATIYYHMRQLTNDSAQKEEEAAEDEETVEEENDQDRADDIKQQIMDLKKENERLRHENSELMRSRDAWKDQHSKDDDRIQKLKQENEKLRRSHIDDVNEMQEKNEHLENRINTLMNNQIKDKEGSSSDNHSIPTISDMRSTIENQENIINNLEHKAAHLEQSNDSAMEAYRIERDKHRALLSYVKVLVGE